MTKEKLTNTKKGANVKVHTWNKDYCSLCKWMQRVICLALGAYIGVVVGAVWL